VIEPDADPAPPRPGRARTARPILWAVVGVAALVIAGLQARALHEADLGERAFDGRVPLVARIVGHEAVLPPLAAACANCHLPNRVPAGPGGAAAADASLGPRLHRAGLTEAAPRRGGPPSRFDEGAFCRLLRTGEDPAGVLLPRAMPRYEIDDAGCSQLWRHLLRTEG
jgi:hypothetical protein